MTCPSCGSATVAGARFCFACGRPLGDEAMADGPTERRIVTVAFGDLTDFTSWAEDLDPERVGVVTDRVLATLAAVVAEYGGHVDKLTGDGLMAVFGAPTAHEDDAERAVRAAARMQWAVRRAVEEESGGGRRLGLRVGLNTGVVIAGVQAHLSYTVIGDTVNTAARLSDVAGVGAVLAGKDTALATMATASWRALPPLRLKGKKEPVTAYELVGLRPAGASRLGLGDEAPLLGREAELGLLIGRLLETNDRRSPRTVLVTGEAGVGKTRLAQELTRFAGELPDARVLWGRCAPYGEGRDLSAVAEMVRTACGIGEGDDAVTARERLTRTVARLQHLPYAAPAPPAMADRLAAVLGVAEDDEEAPREGATPGSPPGRDADRQAIAALFAALAAEGPLVLVLDDMHWATPAMVEGLLEVVDGLRGRLLLLGLGRPDLLDLTGPAGWWGRLPEAELLPLVPLEESATERLLRSYLGVDGALDPAVREAVVSRAQGNPFFLAELLHLLVDRGILVRDETGWVLAGDVPTDVPAGIQAVLAARIDDLDGAAKGVLRDASVLGSRVTQSGLEAVGLASGHGAPDVVARAVTTLLERRLLELDPEGSEPVLRFAHTLVRDVAYTGLAKSERARRHAAAAAFSQSSAGRTAEADAAAGSQGERAVRLAREMGLPAGDPAWEARGIAFAALVRLGRAALARDDNPAAERVLARALDLAPGPGRPVPPDDVSRARVEHARALVALHELDRADEAVRAVLAEAPGEETVASAQLVQGELLRRRGDVRAARACFVRALAGAATAGADRLTGEALRQLGLLDYFDGRLLAAEVRFREALALAERVGDPRGAGWALQHLAWSATTRGDYDLADATLERAADVFSGLEDPGGLSWVAGTEGFVRLLQGRLAEARELAGSVLPLGEAMGERWGVAALLTIDALAAAALGDPATATEEAAGAVSRFAELGDAWGASLALVATGMAARAAGEAGAAVASFTDAVTRSEGGGHPLTAALAWTGLGYAHLDAGDVAGAAAAAHRAAGLLGGLDLEPHGALGVAVLRAQVLRAEGELPAALAELDAALAGPAQPALLFPRRQALAHRAGLLLDLGRPAEALDAARAAVAEPGEDARSRVLALRALGRALRATGEPGPAAEALTEALAQARATGPASEVAETERLLSGG